jgi:hypothetical protein
MLTVFGGRKEDPLHLGAFGSPMKVRFEIPSAREVEALVALPKSRYGHRLKALP